MRFVVNIDFLSEVAIDNIEEINKLRSKTISISYNLLS